jgi:ribose/xylose/arabinose/galactoside ABC-type transport system permease subunit
MKNNRIKSILMRPEISTLIMFIVIMTGFFIANDKFLSPRNIRIVMGITPEYIIVAIGIAILMISGEFDLSVGSVFALVPMTMVQLVHQGIPPWFAIALGLSIGIAVGFVNGFITLRFGIPFIYSHAWNALHCQKSNHCCNWRFSSTFPTFVTK